MYIYRQYSYITRVHNKILRNERGEQESSADARRIQKPKQLKFLNAININKQK